MPRKTPVKEIQEEETNPGSPLRRSTRLRNSSPVPTKVVTRRSSASEVTTSTPKVNKSRRPSYNQDSESISSSALNKKADNSVLKEKENGKDETNLVSSEAVLDKKKVPRRRRSSVEDIQNNQNETVEALTNSKTVDTKESPMKKKSLDSKKTLESIEEINGEAESPVAEKSKTNFVAQRKKSDPIKIDLSLSVIKETSFTEADKDIENEEKEASENQIEHKTSPLKTSNLVKEESLPLLKSSSVDKNVNQSDGPYEANASVNSLHLELSSELNNKDETVPSISNKENICPTEEKLIQEPEEPMDIDESQSSLFLSESLSTAKNEDGNLTLNTSVKNDEITKKLEIVEKDNDEIAKFLLEETKSSSSNKSQNESEDNKQIEEPKEPDIDVNGTCEDNKKVSLENSVVTKPEVKENESLIEEDEISLQIKETEESTKVDEISLQVKKTEETIKDDEISLQIEETEETMKDDEISLQIEETEESIKGDEISLQVKKTEETINDDEISLQVKKAKETVKDDEISLQIKETEETIKDDEISLQIKETEESTKVDEISLQVKKTEETIKDDEMSLQIEETEETIKDDEMSLQIEETEETIIKDCKPIHNSKEEKDTFQNAQILDSKITKNSEMQVSEEEPEELHQEEKKTDSADTTIIEKNEEILNKSSDNAGSDKMLLENTKTNNEQCHLPEDTKINEENTKIITEMHDSSEDTKTKEEDSHLSKNTKTPSPESNKKIQESLEMKHKDEEIKVPKEETYKCQENVKVIKMSSKRRIVSAESQDDSVQIEESQTPEKMNFDSTLNSSEEYESKNSDYSTKDSPTTNQNTSKETEICVPTQMETSPAESLDKVSSTITTHENNSIKKSENKIDKCEEKNESDILHQNTTVVCKEKFSKVVDLSENNQDKENGDAVRLLKKTSFIIRTNIKSGEDKERHIHDCISKLSTLMNARIKNKGDVSIKFLAEYTCEDSTVNEIFSQAESDALSGNLECEKEEDENNTSPIKIHRIQTPYKSSTNKEKLEDMKTSDRENSESEESSEDFTWVPSDDEIMSDASTSEDSCREESLMEELNELEEEEEENQPELLENQKKRKTRKLFRLSTYDVSELLVRNSPEIRRTKTEEKKQDNAKQKRNSPNIRTTKIEQNNEKQNTSIKKTKIPEFIIEEFQDNKAKKRKHLAIETPNNSFLAEKADDIRPAKKKALSDEFLDKKIVVKPSTSGSEGWKTKI